MEGETLASVQQTMGFMHERILPTLENNIKSGNSLIDMDFYDGELEFVGTERKIKPFNWQAAFPEVFKQGGFDCVIGNPPYVNFVALSIEERNYFKIKYKTYKNKSDLYSFFIERAFSLIKKDNYRFSFIVPHTWLATDSFELLRQKLLSERTIEKIVELGFKVFEKVIVSTIILVCSPNNNKTEVLNRDFTIRYQIDIDIWRNNNNMIDLKWSVEKQIIDERLKNNSENLGRIIEFSRGIKTSNDSIFLDTKARNKDYKKIYRGRNIKAYQLNWEGEYIWYRPDLMKEKVGSLPHSKEFFEVPEKLVTQRVNSSMQLLVTYDNEKQYFLDTTNVSRYTSWNKNYSLKYICGILNSKLVNYWYCNKYKMPTIGLYELNTIPIHKIDFTNPAEKKKHDKIVNHVETMLELNRELQKTKSAEEQERLKQRISYTDKTIDALVYELYGLTEEEIKVVEG